MNIIKTNDVLNATEVKELVKRFGATVSIDGNLYQDLFADEIESEDEFQVVINYGHDVQLNLISDDMRANIVLGGLKGQCKDFIEDGINKGPQWVAEIMKTKEDIINELKNSGCRYEKP